MAGTKAGGLKAAQKTSLKTLTSTPRLAPRAVRMAALAALRLTHNSPAWLAPRAAESLAAPKRPMMLSRLLRNRMSLSLLRGGAGIA